MHSGDHVYRYGVFWGFWAAKLNVLPVLHPEDARETGEKPSMAAKVKAVQSRGKDSAHAEGRPRASADTVHPPSGRGGRHILVYELWKQGVWVLGLHGLAFPGQVQQLDAGSRH